MKKVILILLGLMLCGCASPQINYDNHKQQSLFVKKNIVEKNIQINNETLKTPVTNNLTPFNISIVDGKEKLDSISKQSPDFYGQLYKIFLNYEQGNIKDLVDIFFPYSTDGNYLFNRYVDAQITANTKIKIINTYFYNDKLTIDLSIEYVPTFYNMMNAHQNVSNITSNYEKYSKIGSQKDSFSIIFDIAKYSSSEKIKIKNYNNKDEIIRALTNGFYDSKKEIIQYSNTNNQAEIDDLLSNMKSFNFAKLQKNKKINIGLKKMVSENNDLAKYIYGNITVKSINKDYLLITYPNIKTYIMEYSPSIEQLTVLIKENKLDKITKLIYDPDLSHLYELINNMFL